MEPIIVLFTVSILGLLCILFIYKTSSESWNSNNISRIINSIQTSTLSGTVRTYLSTPSGVDDPIPSYLTLDKDPGLREDDILVVIPLGSPSPPYTFGWYARYVMTKRVLCDEGGILYAGDGINISIQLDEDSFSCPDGVTVLLGHTGL